MWIGDGEESNVTVVTEKKKKPKFEEDCGFGDEGFDKPFLPFLRKEQALGGDGLHHSRASFEKR